MGSGLALAIVVVLVAVNACFVAAEYGIVTVRRSRIEALSRGGSRRAILLKTVLADLDAHISAIQLAITSVGLAIGWLGEPALAVLVADGLKLAGFHNPALAHSIGFVLAFAAITSVVVVAGELAPKFLGLRRTEQVALWTAPLVYGFARITRPLLELLNRSSALMLKLVGVTRSDPDYEAMDAEELRIFLSQLSSLGRLSGSKRKMIENVVDFSEHTAKQIMVPPDQIDYLSLERPMEENLAITKETGHTRYPLCESGLDSVVGMIHIKDLFHRAGMLQASEDLRLIQHDMLFVPETQSIDDLLRLFQRRRAHMAIIVDEYGVPTGLVTMEDVLEELVGEIQDEFDADEAPSIIKSSEGVLIDGMLLIQDLRRELDLEIDIEEVDADTVGGYVTNLLGKIARVGDRFELGRYRGRVVEMQGRRVARVLLAAGRQTKVNRVQA